MSLPDQPQVQPICVRPQGAHLVGSTTFDDCGSTFRTATSVLGSRLKRVPDGEVGERFHWIAFQPNRLSATVGLERVGDTPIVINPGAPVELDVRQLRLAPGTEASALELPSLGYADAAIDSWAEFERLRTEGVIPAQTRFMVALPTPLATVSSFIWADDRPAVEPVYEAALALELDRILTAIPHDSLAIQWDCAVEFGFLESADAYRVGAFEPWWEDLFGGLIERAARQAGRVPDSVELGFHLCYGDSGEKHFIEPKDASNLVKFANALVKASPRALQFLHLPVPIERDDSEYFAPLAGLELSEGTELYLGLVHREDGVAGAERRIAAAAQYVAAFGVSTECGFGRAPKDQTVPLLETHAAVSVGW